MSFALMPLLIKTEFTVDRSLSTHVISNCDSKGLFTTVKKQQRMLSSWGDNVYVYDF